MTTIQVGDKVKHKKIDHLTDGTIKEMSQSGKKATVTWGYEETNFGYQGTVYLTSSLEKESK